jgi:hypothetical protein
MRCPGGTSPQSECAPAIAFIDDLSKMCAIGAQSQLSGSRILESRSLPLLNLAD